MIELVISGGQTGGDEAGLEAAHQFGIKTSGYAPLGYMTADGPNEELLRGKYGLGEHGTKGYKARTYANVKYGEGTIRCCVDFWTAGEICTMNAIKHYKKPHFDIYLFNPPSIDRFIIWLLRYNITILNVAGNTQGTKNIDIYSLTFDYITKTLKTLKAMSTSEEYYDRFIIRTGTNKNTR